MKLTSFLTRKRSRLELERKIDLVVFYLALLGFIAVFIDVGKIYSNWHPYFDKFYFGCLILFLITFSIRAYLHRFVFKKKRERWLVLLELLFLVVLLLAQYDIEFLQDISSRNFLQLAISLIFIVEISKRSLGLEKLKVNPPLLFIFSFLTIIIIGTLALLLPISTHNGIDLVDALFTCTSAVCVTGLTVVETSTHFTRFGQNVIISLIFLGGLGVMTFTSFFGFFFKGETSFRNQMIYKDFMGEENLRNVYSTIIKIVSLAVGVEVAGAALLFMTLSTQEFSGDVWERVYFSVFHSVSAFNNAGFQLKINGLYNEALRYNYSFQTILASLIIFGGLGFYICFNIVHYLRDRARARIRHLLFMEPYQHKSWVLNFNSKIVLITTAMLLVVGTLLLFLTEYNGALKEHEGIGKWVVAFFCGVTSRTAGFNNIDYAFLSREGILVTMLLMWIGASPGSTGGGIKTSTIAIALLGIFNIAQGKDRVEFARREIAKESLLRAFVIICLSLIVLGLSTAAVVYFNPSLPMEKIAFECFSAFSTTGLSLGITSDLSQAGKLAIILTMFVGRVGTLTILIGILRKSRVANFYRYPVENVIIT